MATAMPASAPGTPRWGWTGGPRAGRRFGETCAVCRCPLCNRGKLCGIAPKRLRLWRRSLPLLGVAGPGSVLTLSAPSGRTALPPVKAKGMTRSSDGPVVATTAKDSGLRHPRLRGQQHAGDGMSERVVDVVGALKGRSDRAGAGGQFWSLAANGRGAEPAGSAQPGHAATAGRGRTSSWWRRSPVAVSPIRWL